MSTFKELAKKDDPEKSDDETAKKAGNEEEEEEIEGEEYDEEDIEEVGTYITKFVLPFILGNLLVLTCCFVSV